MNSAYPFPWSRFLGVQHRASTACPRASDPRAPRVLHYTHIHHKRDRLRAGSVSSAVGSRSNRALRVPRVIKDALMRPFPNREEITRAMGSGSLDGPTMAGYGGPQHTEEAGTDRSQSGRSPAGPAWHGHG